MPTTSNSFSLSSPSTYSASSKNEGTPEREPPTTIGERDKKGGGSPVGVVLLLLEEETKRGTRDERQNGEGKGEPREMRRKREMDYGWE